MNDLDTAASGRFERFLLIVTLFCVATVIVISAVWIYDHPFGVGWDETGYINRVLKDFNLFKTHGIETYVRAIGGQDIARPPAYRFVVFPFVYIFGTEPRLLRMVSLLFFAVSLTIVLTMVKSICGLASACVTTTFLAICPIVARYCKLFYTESILYFAIILTMLGLLKHLSGKQDRRYWICMGLGLGVGVLSKTSFLLVCGPMFLMCVIFSLVRPSGNLKWRFLVKALVVGFIIGGPWWVLNYDSAFAYAEYASSFHRHSIGDFGTGEAGKWLEMFTFSAGPALVVFSVLVGVGFFVLLRSGKQRPLDKIDKLILWCCFFGIWPLSLAHFYGQNQNIRLLSPVMIPLAIIVGVMFKYLFLFRSRSVSVLTVLFFLVQLVYIIAAPAHAITTPAEQADWAPLRKLCKSEGLDLPKIAYVGNFDIFNSNQMVYPWRRNGESVKLKCLWHFEKGRIDWENLTAQLSGYDIILTVPEVKTERKVYYQLDGVKMDNQHNEKFYQKLLAESEFRELPPFSIGRLNPVEVKVFLRKRR